MLKTIDIMTVFLAAVVITVVIWLAFDLAELVLWLTFDPETSGWKSF